MQSSRDHALASLGRASRLATILIEQADVEIERAGLLDVPFARASDPPAFRRFGMTFLDGVRQLGRRETFTYGPFRNRPMRSKPSAQRRQRLARRIARAHRK